MKNFLLLLLSVIIGLVVGEGIIRFWWEPNGVNISRTEFSEWGYLLNPSQGKGLQKLGKSTITCHYYWPHLRDTPLNKQAKNILVLGDSFTFGWMLPWEKTYLYQLQTFSDNQFGKDKYRFLNAAVGGWGAADFLAYLQENGDKISPQYVLIFLNTDDIGRAMKQDIYRFDPQFSLLTPHFHPLKMAGLRTFLFNNWLYEHSSLLQFIRNNLSLAHINQEKSIKANTNNKYTIPLSTDLEFEDAHAIAYAQALFIAIDEWCQQHQAKLLVVTTGFNAFYPADAHDPTRVFLSSAEDFFAKYGIAYHDISTDFQKSVEGKVFQLPVDKHPNELGAKVIAELSWPWLKAQMKRS